jgi:transcriptional regulator with XRE-family HTH domain
MKERDQLRMEAFRINLRRLRVERGWKQHDLASRCDVTRSKISALETNSSENLNLTTLFELAKGLSVHPIELIDYSFDFLK